MESKRDHSEKSVRRGASGRILRRRSLLKSDPDGSPLRTRRSPAQMILLSYATALLLYALWLLVEPLFGIVPVADRFDRLVAGLLPIGLFVVPIILLGHYGLRYREGRTGEQEEDVVVRTGIWIGAGVLGSIVGYEVLLLLRVGLPGIGVAFLTAAFTVNFAAVLLASLAGTAITTRRRGRLLHSQQKLLTDEFRAAYRMQQSLLPSASAGLYGFDIAAAMQPAVEVGGDYYDYITFADGSKGIVVADASGKGVPAALMMAKFQGMAQALAGFIADPAEFFIGLNDTLRVRLGRQSFITVGLVTIDFDDNCRFWRAGHNELLHYHATDDRITLRRPPGLALGLTHGGTLSETLEPESFRMETGDVLLLFSDGLSESCSPAGEEFGEERLPETLRQLCRTKRSATEVRDGLLRSLEEFLGEGEGQDDVTIVVIRKEET